MHINQSTEQGVVVLLMLALEKDHRPVGSQTLSTVMGVSDSYLKKTLRKLVVAGLVISTPGRDGGFVLARPLDQITLGDAFRALDPEGLAFPESPIAQEVFGDCNQLSLGQWRVAQVFADGSRAFEAQLDAHPLTELLKPNVWQEGARDWTAEALALRQKRKPAE